MILIGKISMLMKIGFLTMMETRSTHSAKINSFKRILTYEHTDIASMHFSRVGVLFLSAAEYPDEVLVFFFFIVSLI